MKQYYYVNYRPYLNFTRALFGASLVAQTGKNLPTMRETQIQSLGQKDSLEKGMPAHFNILVWKIPWTEEPGGLQSMGSQSWISPKVFFFFLFQDPVQTAAMHLVVLSLRSLPIVKVPFFPCFHYLDTFDEYWSLNFVDRSQFFSEFFWYSLSND